MFLIQGRAMRRCLLVLAVVAALAAVLIVQPVGAGSSGVTLASGSFTLLGPDFGLPNGTNRTYAFTVNQSSDGTVTGQVQLVAFSSAKVHGDVNCFVLEGNQAIVGGTITFDPQLPEFLGTPFAFAIQDNPDVSTFMFFNLDFGASPCEGLLPAIGEPDLPTLLADRGLPIATGNIMIRQAN
jgi:hypothetical protein